MSADRSSLRIDWVSPPFAGHLFPILTVAQGLWQRGFHGQRILSTPSACSAAAECGLPFVPLLAGKESHILGIANTETRVGASPRRLLRQFKDTLGVLGVLGEELEREWSSDPPRVVIADRVLPTAGFAARAAGAAWWTSMTSVCPTETRTGVPAYLGGLDQGSGPWRRIRNGAGRAATRTFKRSAAWLARRELRAIGLERIYRSDGTEAFYSEEKILAFGLPEFEFERRDWPPALEFVGPALGSPIDRGRAPGDVPPVDPGTPHVLVTIGTHLLWAKERAASAALELSRRLPGWVVHFSRGDARPGAQSAGVRQTGPRCFEIPYVPYDAALARYAAIVHHGGSGISYAALASGVPALVWPHDYDQFDHAAQIVHHGFGLRTNGEPAQMAHDLLRLHGEPEFRGRVVWMAGQIAASDPVEASAAALDRLSSPPE
ncbi:MurG-like transferase [Planctomycetes bacterium Poly30]|uniref:MurG-like transferase n=1 Tax=Saltatorellus ferox TaxID=2528018 RepID=A0A518EPE1_9BACT|nr:MurG-like transferase [Planctomycetes bacterium Poly30]